MEVGLSPSHIVLHGDPAPLPKKGLMLDVLYHQAKIGGGLNFARRRAAKNVEFLSVCLFVCHAFERQSLCTRFRHEGVGGTETVFISLDIGRFVVVHLCLTFSDRRQLATPQSPKMAKFAVFRYQMAPE